MKKILFVIRQLHGGGAERVTAALANEICKQEEYEVHVITFVQDQIREYVTDSRIIRHHLKEAEAGRLRALFARYASLKEAIRQIDPDCVISLDGPRMVVLLSAVMAGSKTPLILSERNDPSRYPSGKALKALRFFAYAACDGLVFQTTGAKDYFPAWIGRKSTVICNPLSEQLPSCFEGARQPRIVNFCRLTPQKNLELLLDAFADISLDFPQYTLHIFGDGPQRDALEAKIQKMQMTEKVSLHGYVNPVYDAILDAALFVSSSDYEGISNSMLEAIAIGIPSICTDCPPGGAREVIENGVNGVLVPTGDRKALAEAMVRVISDDQLAASLSAEGQKLRHKLCVEAVARQWVDYIEQIIQK